MFWFTKLYFVSSHDVLLLVKKGEERKVAFWEKMFNFHTIHEEPEMEQEEEAHDWGEGQVLDDTYDMDTFEDITHTLLETDMQEDKVLVSWF